jgi:hypothetical protein
MLRRDRQLIVANCHSHTLLWDLTAQFTKQGGTTIGLVYYCGVIASLFEDCGVFAVLIWQTATLRLHRQLIDLLWHISTSPLLWDLSAH